MENVLDKYGSLKTKVTVVSKLVPKIHAVQDSKTIAKNVDRDLDIILQGAAIPEEEITPVFDLFDTSKTKATENVPKDIAEKFNNDEKTIIKYTKVLEDVITEDKWAESGIPLQDRNMR